MMMMMKVLSQVIAAEGEQKASRALKEAAAVINESPSALQVDHHGDGDDGGEDDGGGEDANNDILKHQLRYL